MADTADPQLRIWVDADAAPRDVKEVVYRAARRLEISAILVANQPLEGPRNNPYVSSVHVPGGLDVADDYIVEHAEPGDLAVTADIPLAAQLVPKGVIVLNPRGELYTDDNIRERLSVRDFMDSLRGAGVMTGGPAPYGPREKKAFAGALDRTLAAQLRK